MIHLASCSLLVLGLIGSLLAYEIPEPTFKVYRKGFDVSVPYEDGIELCVFTGSIISKIQNYDLITFVGMVRQPDEHGYLTYKNKDTVLTVGVIINYYIDVKKNGEDFLKADLIYTVRGYEEPATYGLGEIQQYTIPDTKFKVYREGFEVSIPHENGIEYFVFTTDHNSKTPNCGIFFAYIRSAENGRWTYRNFNAKLILGQTVYYHVAVVKNGKYYCKNNLSYTVRKYENPATSGLALSFAHKIPEATIKVYRKGFEVSIPHKDGTQHLFFTSSINSEIRYPSDGSFSLFSSRPDADGCYTYKNDMAKLQLGDTIYYYIIVVRAEETYILEPCSYTVKHYKASSTELR